MRFGYKCRRSRQRGAEVLESALVSVPLFALTFLLLDVSMVIFQRATLQHAVRQGVRYAITGATNGATYQDDAIKTVVQKNALGFLNGTGPAATMHVHWIDPATGSVADNTQGNIVGVTVEGYQYGALAPFMRLNMKTVQIWAQAYDIMQGVPPGTSLPPLRIKE